MCVVTMRDRPNSTLVVYVDLIDSSRIYLETEVEDEGRRTLVWYDDDTIEEEETVRLRYIYDSLSV